MYALLCQKEFNLNYLQIFELIIQKKIFENAEKIFEGFNAGETVREYLKFVCCVESPIFERSEKTGTPHSFHIEIILCSG